MAKKPGVKWINIDRDKRVNPDLVLDLELAKFPYKNNTIDGVKASHILEHIENFIPLMEEIYRVCKPGAILNINAPYGLSPAGIADPTHVRYLCPWTFKYFDKSSGYFLYDFKCNFKIIKTINNGGEIHVEMKVVK